MSALSETAGLPQPLDPAARTEAKMKWYYWVAIGFGAYFLLRKKPAQAAASGSTDEQLLATIQEAVAKELSTSTTNIGVSSQSTPGSGQQTIVYDKRNSRHIVTGTSPANVYKFVVQDLGLGLVTSYANKAYDAETHWAG
jgi:hypothetical protein